MKTAKLPVYAKAVVFLLWLMFPGFSCSRKPICETCVTVPPLAVKDVSFDAGGQILSLNGTEFWANQKTGRSEMGETGLDVTAYETFNSAISRQVGDAGTSFITVLYINKKISSDPAISDKGIQAISRFSVQGKMLRHDFYQKQDNKFVKVEKLSILITLISSNAISYISNNIVFPGSEANTYLLIEKKENLNFSSRNRLDILLEAAKKYVQFGEQGILGTFDQYEFYSSLLKTTPASEDDRCGDKCFITRPRSVCVRNLQEMYPASWYCLDEPKPSGGFCRSLENREAIQASQSMAPDSISIAYNDSLHYALRAMMAASNFGSKYIGYYSLLSNVYSGQLDMSLILRTTRTLSAFNSSIDKLVNGQVNSNEVFLTSEMKNRVLGLFTEYRTIYSDTYVEMIYNDIAYDMNRVENKTLGEVLSLFQ